MEYLDIIKTSMLGFGIVMIIMFVVGYLSYLFNKKVNKGKVQFKMADFENKTAIIVETPNCQIGGCEKNCDPDGCLNFNCRHNRTDEIAYAYEYEVPEVSNKTPITNHSFNRNQIRWR